MRTLPPTTDYTPLGFGTLASAKSASRRRQGGDGAQVVAPVVGVRVRSGGQGDRHQHRTAPGRLALILHLATPPATRQPQSDFRRAHLGGAELDASGHTSKQPAEEERRCLHTDGTATRSVPNSKSRSASSRPGACCTASSRAELAGVERALGDSDRQERSGDYQDDDRLGDYDSAIADLTSEALRCNDRESFLNDKSREHVERQLRADDDPTGRLAKYVTELSDRDYFRAFAAWMRDPISGGHTWSTKERDAVRRVPVDLACHVPHLGRRRRFPTCPSASTRPSSSQAPATSTRCAASAASKPPPTT